MLSIVESAHKVSEEFSKSSGFREFMEAQKNARKVTEDANQETKKRIGILADLDRAERALAKAHLAEAQTIQGLRLQTAELNKSNKEQAKTVLGMITPYQKFAKQVNDSKKEAKSLGAEMILLEQRFKKGEISQRQYNSQLNKLSKEYVEATLKAKGLDSTIKKIDSSVGDSQRNVGNYKSALGGLTGSFKNLLAAFGVVGAIDMFASLIKDSYETVKVLNAQNYALNEVFQTESQVARQKEYLTDITERYGLSLVQTTQDYTKFSAAVKGTSLEGEKGRAIFESFSGASAKLGLGAEQTTGIFKALEQMISKGKIQAEELRGQLGDRMAGSFQLFAAAIGVSTAELDQMLKKGEITSDVLTKVSDRLNETYGLDSESRVDNITAAQNRLSNSWTYFLDQVAGNQDIVNALAASLEFLAGTFNILIEEIITGGNDGISVLSELGETITILTDLFSGLGIPIKNLPTPLESLQFSLRSLQIIVAGFNGWIKTLVGSVDALFHLLTRPWDISEFKNKLSEINNTVDTTSDKIKKLNRENAITLFADDDYKKSKAGADKFNKLLADARKAKKAYFQYDGIYYNGVSGRSTRKSTDDFIDIKEEGGTYLQAKQKTTGTGSTAKSGATKKARTKRDTSASDAKKEQREYEQQLLAEYNAEKENIDRTNQLRIEAIKNNIENAKKDPYSTETQKLTEQINFYSDLIKANDEYYNELIENSKKYDQNKFIPDFERQRDIKSGEFDSSRNALSFRTSDALKSDLEYSQKIEDLAKSVGYEEAKRLIISDKSLSLKEREYQLQILDFQNNLENLNNEKERIEARQKDLQAKARFGSLTRDEATEWAEIAEKAIQIENSITETTKQLELAKFNKIAEGFAPVVDLITNGFNDLGLDGIASQFSSMYDRILKEGKEFSLTTADYLNAASAVIADFSSQLVEAQTEKRIAALDEELKHSQETTEQEIGFIEGRLERLNALDELTAEQIEERNALEDQARTLKEQQLQREKQIEEQKAKALQRAAAQQALISAGQAAVLAFASQLIPGDPTSLARAGIASGIALGVGALQAGLIMSRDPIPNYFVGRSNGPSEFAYTQEKGREIITDQSGNIKSLGSDNGAVLTKLNAGDKVFTAIESMRMLSVNPSLNLGANIHKIDNSKISPIIFQNNIDYDKLSKKVGDQFAMYLKKYSTSSTTEDENGNIFKEKPGQIPVFIGKRKPTKQNLEIKINNRNVRD